MGVLLFLCLAPSCFMVIRRRRRAGEPFIAPLAAVALLIVAAIWSAPSLVHGFSLLARFGDPSAKATLLAIGISTLLNCAAFLVVVVAPLGLAGYFVDRWLITRWKRRSTLG